MRRRSDGGTAKVVVLFWASVTAGCFGRSMTFDHLQGADRVEVRDGHDALLKTIDDAATIEAAHAVVARHDLGWGSPWFGRPAPRLRVSFYQAGRLLGEYGVGRNFLTTDPGPDFMSRAIPRAEALHIAGILGVPLPSD